MAVKYVKDFAFDSGFGYTGSAGKTPVRGYNRGGKVFDDSTRNPISKFPELAPAMVGKGPGKMGGKTSDVAPMSTAKANPQIAKFAKGGAVKKPVKAKMMGKPMKKANGGEVASPLQLMAEPPQADLVQRPMPAPYTGPLVVEEDPKFYKDVVARMEAETERPMPMLQEERLDGLPPLPPELMDRPLGDLRRLPEIDYSDMPIGVMGGGDEYWREGGIKDQQSERTRKWLESKGLPLGRPAGGNGPQVPLARAAVPTKADRMATRRDNMMAARDIMDRYIAGPRTMMSQPRRRSMPVAPQSPMIEPAMMRNPRSPDMNTYAKGGKVSKGEQKIGKVMGEYKRGELHSGSKKGPVVTNPKQAKAIALSEARAAGAKIPKKAMGGKACG